MEREIKFRIKVSSKEEFEKIAEKLRVQMANMELAGKLEIIDLGPQEKTIK